MKKPEHLRWKLGCFSLFAGLLALWYWLDLPCVFRTLTGFPCVTCGLTRAWLCALRLDLGSAFRYYPMFWSVPVLAAYLLYDGSLFSSRRVNFLILGLILAGIFLIYFARLFDFLGGLSPL